ncbi:MAG TPA: thioredoxin-disulfide reductase [Desulfobacteria bacterium]|nr:thioredoxin-disulfide reductase [Desulfobacteria bacterium]
MYDLVILGGGPAGLTAGIYAARARLKTCLVERGMPGGLAATTETIENYPGFPGGVSGSELMLRFQQQAEKLGVEFRTGEVEEVNLDAKVKQIHVGKELIEAKAVILATGSKPKQLGVPGEADLYGQGVSYCATCDGAFFRNKQVIVVGGGDAAVDEAQFLTRFADKVTIVHRRREFRAAQISLERAKANPKIEFYTNAVVESIIGDNLVEAVAVKDVHDGQVTKLPAQGVFVYVGNEPNTKFLSGKVELSAQGYIKVDTRLHTSLSGVFAAGDVRDTPLRQVSTAVGDGAVAAMEAERFLAAAEA